MPNDVIQIVDAISASPTVLLDLNNESPLGVSAFDAPPPQLVRNLLQTQARDGATDAGSVYGDRVIDIDIDHYAASQDLSASTFQTLARLLSDPRGQWLKYQPNGATKPVFFRLRRGDITAIAALNASAALKEIHLTLPAEPFAYGLAVQGSVAAIANDPTAGTNPMRYAFPAVEGDVATPVQLLFPDVSGSRFDRGMISMCSGPSAPAATIYSSTPSTSAVAGWAFAANFADATAVGGTTARFTKSSGTLSQSAFMSFNPVPPGDYRVVARMRTPVAVTVKLEQTFASSILNTASVNLVAFAGQWVWRDFGVFHLPSSKQRNKIPGLSDAAAALASFTLTLSTAAASGDIDFDVAILVPAGLDDDAASSLLLTGLAAANSTFVDGIEGRFEIAGSPAPMAGGFPTLTPGVPNVMTIVLKALSNGADGGKTQTATLTWLYYPRYLHVRPATS